jgi:hypothetical protein
MARSLLSDRRALELAAKRGDERAMVGITVDSEVWLAGWCSNPSNYNQWLAGQGVPATVTRKELRGSPPSSKVDHVLGALVPEDCPMATEVTKVTAAEVKQRVLTTSVYDKAALAPTPLGVGYVWGDGNECAEVPMRLWSTADWELWTTSKTVPHWPDMQLLPVFAAARKKALEWSPKSSFAIVHKKGSPPMIFPTEDEDVRDGGNNAVDRFFYDHPKARIWDCPSVKLVLAPKVLPYPKRRWDSANTLESMCGSITDLAQMMRLTNQVLYHSKLLTKYGWTNAAIYTGDIDRVSPTRHARFFATAPAELCRGLSNVPIHALKVQKIDDDSVPRLIAVVPQPDEVREPLDVSGFVFHGWEAREAVETRQYWLDM